MINTISQAICLILISSGISGICQQNVDHENAKPVDTSITANLNTEPSTDGSVKAFVESYKKHVEEERFVQANKMLNYYVLAQVAFHNNFLDDAMNYIRHSLAIIETYEAYMLMALIYYKQDELKKHKMCLNKAREIQNMRDQDLIHGKSQLNKSPYYLILQPSKNHTMIDQQKAGNR